MRDILIVLILLASCQACIHFFVYLRFVSSVKKAMQFLNRHFQ